MKFIKTLLRNRITECSLSDLIKIAIDSPKTFTEKDVEENLAVLELENSKVSYLFETEHTHSAIIKCIVLSVSFVLN